MQINYWKWNKKDNRFYYHERPGKERVKETIEKKENQTIHTVEYEGRTITFTARCGYDRGPGLQRRLHKVFFGGR